MPKYVLVDEPPAAEAPKAPKYLLVSDADPEPPPSPADLPASFHDRRQRLSVPPTPQTDPFDPTLNMGAGERFAAGAGKAIYDAARGVMQRGAELGNWISPGLVTDQALASLQGGIDEARRLDAPLMNTGMGTLGNVAGNAAIAAAPGAAVRMAGAGLGLAGAGGGMPEALMVAGRSAMLPSSILGSAAQGAAMGAVTPTASTDPDSAFARNVMMGGAAGGVMPLIGALLRGTHATLQPLTEGGRAQITGRLLNRLAGNSADDVINRLESARELIPGSLPTAANVAESGGIAALQRAVSGAEPEEYTRRLLEQAAARQQALKDIAGDAMQRQAARDARSAATDPLYRAAGGATVPADAQLAGILDRLPGGVMDRARNLARMNGETFSIPGTPTGALDVAGNPVMSPDEWSGSGLHYIKLAIDDTLDNPALSGIGAHEARSIAGVKNDLLGWMDNAIPPYQQARAAFAGLSRPINQMDIGQLLYDKMAPALSDYGAIGRSTAQKYAAALRDAEATSRSATGFAGPLEKVMTPDQMQTLQAVAQDLARHANAQDLGRGAGSNTFQNFSMANIAERSGVPLQALEIPLLGRALNVIYRNTDDLMRQSLAQALLDPQATAAAMRAAGPTVSSARLARLAQYLRAMSQPALTVLPVTAAQSQQ